MVAGQRWRARERNDSRVVLRVRRAIDVLERGSDGAVVENELQPGNDVVKAIAGPRSTSDGHDVPRRRGERHVRGADGEARGGCVPNKSRQPDKRTGSTRRRGG